MRWLCIAISFVFVSACVPTTDEASLISRRAATADPMQAAFADATAFREETVAYNAGLSGYIYGYPAIDYGVLMKRLTTPGVDPEHYASFFEVQNYGKLLGPGEGFSSRAPNNDTMYFYSWLDLRAGPVQIDAPEVRGRYHVLTYADFYAETVNTGRRTTGDGRRRSAYLGRWP